MSPKQFFLVLLARWKLVIGVFAAVVVCGALYTLTATKLYTAAATVVVEPKADPIAGVVYQSQLQSGYIATQVDIIGSERVAQRVVKILKLDQSPQFVEQWRESTGGKGDMVVWLGAKLQKKVAVTPSRDSSVIEIAVEWTDGKTAAVLANAFAQAYMDVTVELRVDPAKQNVAWFDERSQALRADLQAKQKRLSDFQTESGVIASDGRMDVENARLAELSSQLVNIQGVRQDSQSRQQQLGKDNDAVAEVLQSPLVNSLKGDLSRAEAHLQDVATSYGKNHPDYQNTAAEVASLRERIASESAKIVASLGNNTQINLRRESDIRAALDAQKKRILELSHLHDQAAVLQNDVASAQRNLDTVMQRLATTSLESQTVQTNISMLTPAVEPSFKSSPRYFINMVITLFVGGLLSLFCGLFAELLDRRVREDSDLMVLPGVPMLAKIPRIKSEHHRAQPVLTRAEPSAI